MFAFVLSHYINHAFGLVSLDAMEAAAKIRHMIWKSPVGVFLLYGSLLVHVALALWKTARRRSFRMPATEALQLVLGLAIPILLVDHIVGTRGLDSAFDIDDSYGQVLTLIWPGYAVNQTALLFIVWVHAIIGLHFWLSPKRIYPRIKVALFAAAILIPALASVGWIEAARRLDLTGGFQSALTSEAVAWATPVIAITKWSLLALIALSLGVGLAGAFGLFERGRFAVTYPGGRQVRARPGQTLLEVSRENGVPHTAVCGGRARCSTCRTRIIDGADRLPPPNAAEVAVLKRIGAAEDVRLACQLRPRGNLSVQPLLPARDALTATSGDSYRWGVERTIAILFVDMRGFTSLSERRLAFDVVFILNQYLAAMSAQVRKNGGIVDKYIGDSVMALYGIATNPERAARQAILTAADMIDATKDLNTQLDAELSETVRIGVGIHAGPSILGRIGTQTSDGLTALGDTVNTASRLESATKELGATVVLSADLARLAGVDTSLWRTEEITVRGRVGTLTVHGLSDAAQIRSGLKAQSDQEFGAAQKIVEAAGR
ncbi:MAG: adenylate/guanylate cyclase domain-containing protein [Pseudomonadota bacterium]